MWCDEWNALWPYHRASLSTKRVPSPYARKDDGDIHSTIYINMFVLWELSVSILSKKVTLVLYQKLSALIFEFYYHANDSKIFSMLYYMLWTWKSYRPAEIEINSWNLLGFVYQMFDEKIRSIGLWVIRDRNSITLLM